MNKRRIFSKIPLVFTQKFDTKSELESFPGKHLMSLFGQEIDDFNK